MDATPAIGRAQNDLVILISLPDESESGGGQALPLGSRRRASAHTSLATVRHLGPASERGLEVEFWKLEVFLAMGVSIQFQMGLSTEMKMLQGVTIKKWEPLEVQTVTPPNVGVPVQVKVPETEVLRTVPAPASTDAIPGRGRRCTWPPLTNPQGAATVRWRPNSSAPTPRQRDFHDGHDSHADIGKWPPPRRPMQTTRVEP